MTAVSLRKVGFCLALVLFAVAMALPVLGAPPEPIGEAARQRAEALARTPEPVDPAIALQRSLNLVWALTAVMVVLTTIVVAQVVKLVGFDPFKKWESNVVNPRLMVAFMVLMALAIGYEWSLHAKYALVGTAASAHGVETDNMLVTSLVITGLAFIAVQIVLFTYAYIYRGREGRKAVFYHDNSRLEALWTLIPAVGIVIMVGGGIRVWNDMHFKAPDDTPIEIELVGQQFNWSLRYAGKDNKLGPASVKLIGAENPLGIDLKNGASQDDIVPATPELILPVGRTVHVNIRSKDVLHGVFMPHFRVQMYAVPGMPTEFTFKPIVTTADMKSRTGNEKFEYEMACSQLCGSAHFNMRLPIRIVSAEEYAKLAATWQPIGTSSNLASR